MKIKEIFDSYYDTLKDQFDIILKSRREETSDILNNFYDNTLNQLEDILNKKQTNNLKSELKEDVLSNLKNNLQEIERSTNEIVINMVKDTKDIVTSNYDNYLFDLNVAEVSIKECKNKITSINYLNKDFIKRYDNLFELFLYSISVEYTLKNDANIYNLINKTINQNKKILFDNLKHIEETEKENLIYEYEHCFTIFTRDVVGLKEGFNIRNSKLLVEYQEEIIKENIIISIKNTLEEDAKHIEKVLLNCHDKTLKLTKSRNTKDKELELNILNSFLLSFNNTLFDKSQNTLLKINSVVSKDKEELEKNTKKYNEMIYNICDFEYNFDKPFLLYRKKLLNKSYFLTTNTTDNVINIIDDSKKQVINIIKKSIVSVFEDNINLINKVTYQRLMTEHKLQNFYGLLDKKYISKLLSIK